MRRKLVILHIDGLSARRLDRAAHDGDMPFVRHLMEAEGYRLHPYRCGVPSTTPFAQAGILYGDNAEIPSFRWWDRERKVLVQFGAGSTFKKVADKYFHGCDPLTKGGACIAACFPAGAVEDFGIAYQDRSYKQNPRSRSAWHVLGPYLANPVHIGDWLWQTVAVAARTARDVADSIGEGRHPARSYVLTDVIEEIFIHHLTRYAVQKAMREGYSPIYAGFYAYDETAHAFGPGDRSCAQILRQVDRTIKKIASSRGDQYEMVVLSDHGQVDTVPFKGLTGRAFGEVMAKMLPGWRVQEMRGKSYGSELGPAEHAVNVTYSGGLAHVYVVGSATRLGYREVQSLMPSFVHEVSGLAEVAFVLARDGDDDVLIKGGMELRNNSAKPLLAAYDDADILLPQLSRMNSFRAAGDVIVFGAFADGKQINFEDQAGGHGSVGGEQLHPFVFAKDEWGLRIEAVRGAHELYPLLRKLRDRLLQSGVGTVAP